ncbi:MAG: TonB-dependent receptor, partial [Polyangiaceae bacterium]|nr:TonB-dependent receptor [Polyangiaceae bacterium]
GTTSPENQYVVDGVSVNNPALGLNGSPLSLDFVEDVNVISGGYMPEYGRTTGGLINVVTKSGSNEFHGATWLNYSPGFAEGERKEIKREGSTIQTQRRVGYTADFGATLGGPILRDRLWFFAGFQLARSMFNFDRSLNRLMLDAAGNPSVDADGFTVVQPIDGTSRTHIARRDEYQTYGKLTFQADRNNRLTATISYMPTRSGGNGYYGYTPDDDAPQVANLLGTYSALANRFVNDALDTTLKWTTETSDKRLLVDTTVGWHHQTMGRRAADGTKLGSNEGLSRIPSVQYRRSAEDPSTGFPNYHGIEEFEALPPGSGCGRAPNGRQLCAVPNYFFGGPGFLEEISMDRYQGRSVVTYLFEAMGHHVAKVGVDFELMRYDHLRGYSGGTSLRESIGGSRFVDVRQYGYLTAPDTPVILDSVDHTTESYTLGGFAQDSWSVMDKVTVNVGLRYDAQFMYGGDGALALSMPNEWSPRAGVIWDPTQQGHAKIYGNYARFYENIPLDIMDRAGSGEPSITSSHLASGCDPRDPAEATGACRDPATAVNPYGGASNYEPDRKWVVTGGGTTPIDPDLKPPSNDELVFGGEYDIIKNGRVGLFYIKRWTNHAIEDMSRDEAQTYFIGNPGYGIASDFPKAKRDYDAITIFFQKSLADTWMAQASYTIAWLRGNYAGLYRPETQQLDPNINSDFDLESLTVNRDGPLPGDRRHDIKLFVAKDIDLPSRVVLNLLNVGASMRAHSGEPTSYLGSHIIYGGDEVFVLPRGAGDRLPWVFSVDAHLGCGIKFSKAQTTVLTLDVFNLINFQEVTGVDETYTDADVNPIVNGGRADLGRLQSIEGGLAEKNPNYGKPTSYQAPRQFRFGIRTTF